MTDNSIWTVTEFLGDQILVFTDEDDFSMRLLRSSYPEAQIGDRYWLDRQSYRMEPVPKTLIEVEL